MGAPMLPTPVVATYDTYQEYIIEKEGECPTSLLYTLARTRAIVLASYKDIFIGTN